jgi:DNA topoisomerase-3
LTSLQREANRRFGWSARRTLSAAQRCYEGHKILTYPRTDSRCLPDDYRDTVREVLDSLAGADAGRLEGMADYSRAASHLVRVGLQNERRVFDQSGVTDHFAIVPTGLLPGAGLGGDDRRLFDLVVRRFLGAFYPPAIWERVERITEVEGERFRTRARSLQEPGWRAVLANGGDEEESASLPPLVPGRDEASGVAVRTTEVAAPAEETKPPPRITEGRLLSLMENAGKQIEDEHLAAVLHEKGIGTAATRAEIIENLIAKGYAVRVTKSVRPTVKGIRLIDTLKRIHVDRLASPQLSGELEKHLLEVERGRRTRQEFMGEMEEYAREIVERTKSFEYDDLYRDDPPVGTCPVGRRPMVERAWFYTCLKDPDQPREAKADPNCANEGCPLLLWKDVSGRYLDRSTAATLLREGKTGVLDGFLARGGRLYRGALELDREEWSVKVRSEGYEEGAASDQPEYEVDPERKLKEAERGRDESLPKSCGFVLPRTVCKREITREEAKIYVDTGRTELLADFTSRYGRPFSATLVLRKSGRHGFEFPPRARKTGAASGKEGRGSTSARKGARAGPRKTRSKKAPAKKSTTKKAARGSARKKTARSKASSQASATRPKSPTKGAKRKPPRSRRDAE